MVTVETVSDIRRTMLTSATAGMYSSTLVADFDLDTAKGKAERVTEPLIDVEPALDEVADALLSDADEEEADEQRRVSSRPSEDEYHWGLAEGRTRKQMLRSMCVLIAD